MIPPSLKDAACEMLSVISRFLAHTDDAELKDAAYHLARELDKEIERAVDVDRKPSNNIEMMLTIASESFETAREAEVAGDFDLAEGKLADTIQSLIAALNMLRERKAAGDINKPVG